MLFTVPCCRSGVVVALFGGRVPEIRTGSAVEKSELNALLTRHKIYIYIYIYLPRYHRGTHPASAMPPVILSVLAERRVL